MKKTSEEQAGNDQVLMLILAIILCITALWAIGCGGQVLIGLSSNDPMPPTPGYLR